MRDCLRMFEGKLSHPWRCCFEWVHLWMRTVAVRAVFFWLVVEPQKKWKLNWDHHLIWCDCRECIPWNHRAISCLAVFQALFSIKAQSSQPYSSRRPWHPPSSPKSLPCWWRGTCPWRTGSHGRSWRKRADRGLCLPGQQHEGDRTVPVEHQPGPLGTAPTTICSGDA